MRRTALTLWIGSLVFAGASAGLTIAFARGDELSSIAMLGSFGVFATVGALLVWRRPHHPIGWIYAIGSLAAVLGQLCSALTDLDVRTPGAIPAAPLVWWVRAVFNVVPLLALISLPLLFFPSGALRSRRWRPLLWIALAAIAAVGSYPAFSDAWFTQGPSNPIAISGAKPLLQGLNELGLLSLGIVSVAAIVSLFRRFRRASGAEREQLKWLAWAGVWTIVLILMAGPGWYGLVGRIESLQPIGGRIVPFLFPLAIALIPLSMAFAILRFRLWDIDRIISRTVSYAAVTAILGGVFALLVLLPVLLGVDEAPDYMVAAATLVVAALFRPVRSRVQGRVERRFNRARYDAEQTIDAFTVRLREQIDIDALGAELGDVVGRTMQPTHLSLWVKPSGVHR